MKKIMLILLALALLTLAACSGSSDQESAKEETKMSEMKTDEKVVITLASGAVGNELEIAKKAAAMYNEKNPNVEIQIWDTPDSASDRLGLYLQFLEAKSAKVDIYQIDVVWPGDMAEHLIDLNNYGAKDVVNEHFKAIVENNTVDGKLVAIPWFTDAGLLYFRTDLLEKYGLSAPKTWADLEKAAKTIQAGERQAGNADFVGFVWQGDAYEGLTCDAVEWVASHNGGSIISADEKITIFNDNAVKALERVKSWIGTISPNGVIAMKEEDARAVWQSGNAAFMRNWPYAYALGNSDDSVIKDKFDVTPIPMAVGGRNAAALGGWQLAVSKYSNNPEIAAEVALFMASEEVQKMRAIDGSFNPTIKSLYQDEEVLKASPFFGSLYDVFINATPRPSTVTAPNYAQVSQEFYQAVYSVLSGEADASDALEDLAYDLEEITGFEIEE